MRLSHSECNKCHSERSEESPRFSKSFVALRMTMGDIPKEMFPPFHTEAFSVMARLNRFVFSFLSTLSLGGPVMRKVLGTAVLAASVLLMVAAGAYGETVTGVLSSGSSSPSSPIDISAGTTDWAYYGKQGGVTSGSATLFAPDVKSGGAASFSNVTAIGKTSDWTAGTGDDSQNYLSFSGGTPTASSSADRHFVYTTTSESFTHTLLATSETLTIYLTDAGSNPINSVSLTATLGNSTYSAAKVTLPYAYDSSHTYGVLALTVSGTVGEVLTFTMTNEGGENSSIGIQAATVTVGSLPEPNTAMLLGAGTIGLLAYAWRRR